MLESDFIRQMDSDMFQEWEGFPKKAYKSAENHLHARAFGSD